MALEIINADTLEFLCALWVLEPVRDASKTLKPSEVLCGTREAPNQLGLCQPAGTSSGLWLVTAHSI